MMHVLEQFPCKEGLNKLVLLNLEIRHFEGGNTPGMSLPKNTVSAKRLREFKSKLSKYSQDSSFGD